MASWNSDSLEIAYQVLGWMACFCWTFSFYPQILLNYRRKSVVGLNFDFVLLNFIKQLSYLTYNAALFFSPLIQRQYREKYGFNKMIPVAANDVAFSIHAVLSKAMLITQIMIYKRGNQRVSKTCGAISTAVLAFAIVCVLIALPNNSWLWLISIFNLMQALITAIKYIPQAFMNYRRKSTEGFSICFVLVGLVGGLANISQMGIQSIDQGTLENFYGNSGKTLLSSEVVFFHVILLLQHYVLYAHKKEEVFFDLEAENKAPLLKF